MSAETITLVLEEKLAGDRDGKMKQQILERLREGALGLKRRMDAGVPPEEFSRLGKTAAALEAATAVVEGVWTRMHPDG